MFNSGARRQGWPGPFVVSLRIALICFCTESLSKSSLTTTYRLPVLVARTFANVLAWARRRNRNLVTPWGVLRSFY